MATHKHFILWTVVDVAIIILAIVGWKHGWFGGANYEPISHSTSTDMTVSTSAPTPLPAKTVQSNNGTVIKIPAQPAPSTTTSGPLDGHTYRISSYNGIAVPAGENYTVVFSQGRVQAKICNSISGAYTAAYGTMSAKELMSTKMACTGPEDIMKIEQLFGTVLGDKATYTATSDGLVITGHGSSIFLTEIR